MVGENDGDDLAQGGHRDQEDCECVACKHGPDVMRAWERKMLDEYGWFIHYVPGDDPLPLNAHTHGLEDKFEGALNLQIVAPLTQEVTGLILHALVKRMGDGDFPEPGKRMSHIIQRYDVTFAKAIENERVVLRVILPDKEGNLDPPDIGGGFQLQYEGVVK